MKSTYSMQKFFEIKIYNRLSNVLKWQIKPNMISGNIEWSESIDGWQGDMSFTLDVVSSDQTYKQWDIVEIREVTSYDKSISPSYTGIIERIVREDNEKWSYITIQILWIFTVLWDVIYEDTGSKVFTKNMTPWNIMKSIIDSFNAKYGSLSVWMQNLSSNIIRYTSTSIDTTWIAVNISFDYTTCLESIKKTLENTGLYWFVWADGICYVQKKPIVETHTMTYLREVKRIESEEHKNDICNKLHLEIQWGWIKVYNNISSQSIFWIKEKNITRTDIVDIPTQDIVGQNYIDENGSIKKETTLQILPIKSNAIKPWDTITIQNTFHSIINQQIVKINKKLDLFEIILWSYTSLGEVVKKT